MLSACETLVLGTAAFARAIGADGVPLDGGVPLRGVRVPVEPDPPAPRERLPIERPCWTGIRAVDALLTFGRGARIGVFGAPGTGKSTLLESIVAGCAADAVVVALAGERGREAQRWIERLDCRTTVVCATSDRPARERVRADYVSAAHAGALRRRGLHVVWLLDSLARVAAALRELGVAAGESTGRGGYPPSVFAELARLVEVAGATQSGSITLVASVLDDGDERDAVSDAARSLLDGHVALSTRAAHAGRFPALDVLASASRTMDAVTNGEHRRAARIVREALSALERTHDARSVGIEPTDARALAAVAALPQIEAFLQQGRRPEAPARSLAALGELADTLEGPHGYHH